MVSISGPGKNQEINMQSEKKAEQDRQTEKFEQLD